MFRVRASVRLVCVPARTRVVADVVVVRLGHVYPRMGHAFPYGMRILLLSTTTERTKTNDAQ